MITARRMRSLILLLCVFISAIAQQMNFPFLSLLSNENIGHLTKIATHLVNSAAEHTMAAHRDSLTRPGSPETRKISLNARPSEIMGQSFTNAISPAIAKFNDVMERQKIGLEAVPNSGTNALIDLADTFLRGSSRNSQMTDHLKQDSQFTNHLANTIPTIRQLAPGANNNFGMPRGEGCVPFLAEFMQLLYGNCVKVADEKTWDTWGDQINNVIFGGRVDLLHATKETCKRGAERQQCGQLRKAISECDILGSLQIGVEMQRAIKRCDEISGIIDQNPVQVLNQVNSIIGGEFAQGFLHRFLG